MSKKTNTVALFNIFQAIDTILKYSDELTLIKEFKNLDEWMEFKQTFPLSPFQIGMLVKIREQFKAYANEAVNRGLLK